MDLLFYWMKRAISPTETPVTENETQKKYQDNTDKALMEMDAGINPFKAQGVEALNQAKNLAYPYPS